MKPLSECTGRELLWTSPSAFSREWELHDRDELCARLSCGWGFHAGAEGETEEGRWRFRRRGFLRGGVEMFSAGAETPLASYRSHWRGGTLRFADGRELKWTHESLWKGIWRFDGPDGTPWLHLRRRARFIGARAELMLDPGEARAPEGPLLALLSWYLYLSMRRRGHAH